MKNLEWAPTGKADTIISDAELETALAACPGERVTPDFMKSRIADTYFMSFDTTTICSIWLDNGFSVRGESACVDPANFNADIGKKLAYDQAFAKLWPLFGFLLAEGRHRRAPGESDAVKAATPPVPAADLEPKTFLGIDAATSDSVVAATVQGGVVADVRPVTLTGDSISGGTVAGTSGGLGDSVIGAGALSEDSERP